MSSKQSSHSSQVKQVSTRRVGQTKMPVLVTVQVLAENVCPACSWLIRFQSKICKDWSGPVGGGGRVQLHSTDLHHNVRPNSAQRDAITSRRSCLQTDWLTTGVCLSGVHRCVLLHTHTHTHTHKRTHTHTHTRSPYVGGVRSAVCAVRFEWAVDRARAGLRLPEDDFGCCWHPRGDVTPIKKCAVQPYIYIYGAPRICVELLRQQRVARDWWCNASWRHEHSAYLGCTVLHTVSTCTYMQTINFTCSDSQQEVLVL